MNLDFELWFVLLLTSTMNAVFIMYWRSYTCGYWKVSKGPDCNYVPLSDYCLWFSEQFWQSAGENVCIVHGARELMARNMQLAWNWRLRYVREYHIWVIRFKQIWYFWTNCVHWTSFVWMDRNLSDGMTFGYCWFLIEILVKYFYNPNFMC